MVFCSKSTNGAMTTDQVERRGKLRIYEPFPATVRGVDAAGQVFESRTTLDNISASGLYLHLWQRLRPGTKLFLVTRFSTDPTGQLPAPRVAIRGHVLRSELKEGGVCGLAVSIASFRFL